MYKFQAVLSPAVHPLKTLYDIIYVILQLQAYEVGEPQILTGRLTFEKLDEVYRATLKKLFMFSTDQ
jgi:hypothetical protein